MHYIINPFKKIFDFSEKSNISEFWIFELVIFLMFFGYGIVQRILGIPEYISNILAIVLILPTVSLGFRRLNDAGINRWLFLIPIVNIILVSLPGKDDKE